MNRPYRQTDFDHETESFEAFDLVTDALENIDRYQRLKDKRFLDRAETRLLRALAADRERQSDEGRQPVNERGYFKARYFLAMVNYLKGEPESISRAIDQFQEMLDESSKLNLSFGEEIRYNLGAAYIAAGAWTPAIIELEQVIKEAGAEHKVGDKPAPRNPDLLLLARAALVLAYVRDREEIKRRAARESWQERAEDEEAAARRKKYEETVERHSDRIAEEYGSIRKELRRPPGESGIDQQAVKQVEQILGQVRGDLGIKADEELFEPPPPSAPPDKPEASAVPQGGRKFSLRFIAILVAAGLLVLIGLLYFYFFVGLNY